MREEEKDIFYIYKSKLSRSNEIDGRQHRWKQYSRKVK